MGTIRGLQHDNGMPSGIRGDETGIKAEQEGKTASAAGKSADWDIARTLEGVAGMTITTAKYKGKCRCCRAVIRPGEAIGYNGSWHTYCRRCVSFHVVRTVAIH